MYHIDRQYGTVVFLAESGISSDAEQIAHLAELCALAEEHQQSGERFVLIIDTRYVGRAMPPAQRKRLSDWLKANDELAKDIVIQTVFIVQSAMVRGALTALEWLGALPPRLTVAGTFNEALVRAQMALMAENLPLHPALAHPSAERRIFGTLMPKAKKIA